MNDQLQDLLIPVKQTSVSLMIYWGLGLLFVFLALAIWRWNKYRSSSAYVVFITAKKINDLKKLPCRTARDSQTIALKLAFLLCEGFAVTRLDQFQPSDKSRWEKFYNRLNLLCYSSNKDSDNNENFDIKSLLDEAQQWLKRANEIDDE